MGRKHKHTHTESPYCREDGCREHAPTPEEVHKSLPKYGSSQGDVRREMERTFSAPQSKTPAEVCRLLSEMCIGLVHAHDLLAEYAKAYLRLRAEFERGTASKLEMPPMPTATLLGVSSAQLEFIGRIRAHRHDVACLFRELGMRYPDGADA